MAHKWLAKDFAVSVLLSWYGINIHVKELLTTKHSSCCKRKTLLLRDPKHNVEDKSVSGAPAFFHSVSIGVHVLCDVSIIMHIIPCIKNASEGQCIQLHILGVANSALSTEIR